MVLFLIRRGIRTKSEAISIGVQCLISAVIIWGLAVWAVPAVKAQNLGAIFGILGALVGGLMLALLWTPSVVNLISRPFEVLFTGGGKPPDPVPNYSKALSLRHQGKFREAIYAIQEQLSQFPADATGAMLLAEIQAVNLKDITAASMTVERLCAQPEIPVATRAMALNALADWHLSVARDSDSAKAALEKIVELFPDTEQAMMALQRLAHLTTPGQLEERDHPRTIPLKPGIQNLGLKKVSIEELVPEKTIEQEAEEMVQHLEQHPFDTETRERLACLYAEKYRRLDLAAEQLEQMIQCPNQPARQVVRWLNLLADFQVMLEQDLIAATATLQRIVDKFPNTAFAAQAKERMANLPSELHKSATSPAPTIKMGHYGRFVAGRYVPPEPDSQQTPPAQQ